MEVERIVPRWQFCSGQKGGAGVGKTKRGKGTKWMVVVDGAGVPLRNQRTFAWLGNYRRLTVRWDRSLTIYNASFHIACF